MVVDSKMATDTLREWQGDSKEWVEKQEDLDDIDREEHLLFQDSIDFMINNLLNKEKLIVILNTEIKHLKETKPVRNKSIRQYTNGVIKGLEIAKEYIKLYSEE